MKKISRLLTYLKDYKSQIALYFTSNLLGILFGMFSLGLLAPVLQVMFKKDDVKSQPQIRLVSVDSTKTSVLQEALFNKMLLQQAEREGLTIPKETLDSQLNNRIAYFTSLYGSPEKMEEKTGKTIEQLKEESREQIRQSALVQKMMAKLYTDTAKAVAANDITPPKPKGLDPLGRITAYIHKLEDERGALTALAYICIAIVVFTVLKNFFLYISLYILNPLRNAILRRLRDDIFTKTLSLPIGFFTEERKGDLISRMTNDINEVELSIMGVLEVFIREPLTIIFYLGAMIFMNYKLTLILLLVLPVAGLIIGRISKSLRKSSNIAQEQLGNMLGVIDETLAGMRVVKAFNAEKTQHGRFMKINNILFRTRNSIAARKELASPLSETMGVIVISLILWMGGRLVLSGNGFGGEWFLTYIAMFSQLISPFKNLSAAFYNVQKGTAALDRIELLLGTENTIIERPDAKPVKSFDKILQLRNVSFAYGDKQILQGVNIDIEKGKTVALVGASGAGKSTLVDLIPRFHDVTGGEILIDGVNIKDCKIDDVRRLMGVVGQDPILFNDTIYNNIILGTGGATQERVEEAARIAHADKFILQKPEAYNTVAGDRGARLSGGERQRVTIARAVLKNPPILILDEATSSLDTESERMVQDAINKLMQNRTCIVIAHRLSTVQHADEIVVMDKGKIAERGTHAELLGRDGIYKKLVEMQQVR